MSQNKEWLPPVSDLSRWSSPEAKRQGYMEWLRYTTPLPQLPSHTIHPMFKPYYEVLRDVRNLSPEGLDAFRSGHDVREADYSRQRAEIAESEAEQRAFITGLLDRTTQYTNEEVEEYVHRAFMMFASSPMA
jgi:hypothetical protein